MLGVDSVISAKVRQELSPESYHKTVKFMWDAIEKEGIFNQIDDDEDLHIVLFAGRKSEIPKLN